MKNKDFDIYEFLKSRPLSYSAFNSFSDETWGDPEKWFKTYILGERQSSPELTFGSYVDKKIQNDPKFLPTLPRYEEMQYKMKAVLGKAIPIVGIPDGVNLRKSKKLADFKTGKIPWNQKKADETRQLTWYIMLLYINLKIQPDEFDCFIHWLPTVKTEDGNFDVKIEFVPDIDNKIQTFKTKRSMTDVLNLINEITVTLGKMQEYVRNHE